MAEGKYCHITEGDLLVKTWNYFPTKYSAIFCFAMPSGLIDESILSVLPLVLKFEISSARNSAGLLGMSVLIVKNDNLFLCAMAFDADASDKSSMFLYRATALKDI